MKLSRTTLSTLTVIGVAIVLAGCSRPSPFQSQQVTMSQPMSLPPVQSSSVQSSQLPPLQGQDGMVTTSNTFNPDANPNSGDPGLMNQQTASADGSFVSLDDVGGTTTPQGRDLSGALTPAKLLGVWTVQSSDLQSCRLNLTQTAKTGTNRYRASAPNCQIPSLALVSSWQLAGSQVQIFDESGSIIGALQLSGNHFIGTLSGGISVTMDG